jgi:hypothetical protein
VGVDSRMEGYEIGACLIPMSGVEGLRIIMRQRVELPRNELTSVYLATAFI